MSEPSGPSKFSGILREVFISILVVTTVSFFARNFLSEGYLIGWDSMTHVFKTWFTMEWLKGRTGFDWCEYWYMGSPIMPMYSPLFYIVSGLLGKLFRVDALIASKWMVFASFPISSLSFYFSTRRRYYELSAAAGAVLYGLMPWHLRYITVLGNPTYSLCFIFLPPLFKFLGEKKHLSLVYASVSFCLIMLSHQGTGFLLAYTFIWYSLFSGFIHRNLIESISQILKIGFYSGGILSFFWIPYIYYSTKTASFMVHIEPHIDNVLQLFHRSHHLYIGLPLFSLFLLSIIITIKLSKSKPVLLYTLIGGLSLILTFTYKLPLINFIYPFTRIIGPGYRFSIITAYMISIVITEAMILVPMMSIRGRSKNSYLKLISFTLPLVVTTLAATFITVLPISHFQNTPIPQTHLSIYEDISGQTLEGRVWWVPRGALQTCVPMFTGRATPDGWYDQGAGTEIYHLIHYLADVQLEENPKYFVEQLTGLSVRYLIIPRGWVYESLKELKGLSLLSEYPDLVLLQVESVDPIRTYPPPPMAKSIRIMGLAISLLFTGYLLLSLRKA